jgi:cell division protein FtsI (penicillin-binding protein 3)
MQMARAYTVFARDGELMPLSLTKIDECPAAWNARFFRRRTMRELRAMLEMAAGRAVRRRRRACPGYRVGGKTGTAYKIEGGVYAANTWRPLSALPRSAIRAWSSR